MDEVLIEVDPELIRKFEELPTAANRNPWTPESEALLIKYWPIKNHADVARLLNVNVNTALKRYRELTSGTGT